MTQRSFRQGSQFPPTKPGLMRLYNMRFCPWAHRTRLVLEHKKIPYETINIDLKSKPAWFLELNPLGQVPVVQIDDKIVVESTATCDWLDDVYPNTRLQPSDPYRRAWDRVLVEYLGKLVAANHKLNYTKDDDEVPDLIEQREKHLAFFEEKLNARDGPFFGGAQPAIVDFLIWPFFERIPMIAVLRSNPKADLDPVKYPTLTSWVKVMWQLPAVKAIGFDAASHAKFYVGHVAGTPEYDLFLEE